ncbi:MAG: alkaline phosphatase family protein [Isosphaeraceae bacterium]|nr:alkaline phosphatase family protein [Isosphaeraceae bacterium]
MAAPASRVLFLGLDGGTMAALGPLFDRGWLPNLAALWRRSAFGTLRSTTPMVTPVAWTSFATGCTPPVHGVHDFSYLDPHDRTIRSSHPGRVRMPHLWQVFTAAGYPVVSLGLPMTYPPPPRVRGLIIGGADAPGFDEAFLHCPEFGAEVRARIPDFTPKLSWKRRPKRLEDLRAEAQRTRSRFRALADVAELADQRIDWGALFVHFHNLDGLQHRLWPYLVVDDTGILHPPWNAEAESCLRALDHTIGRLLELASKRDAAVIAVSDHGFGPCRALVNVNGLLRRAGLQRGLAYGTRFRYRACRLRDRFHRWRSSRASGGRVRSSSRSIEGEVGCDWRRTLAFAPYGQLAGHIFLNPSVVTNASEAEQAMRAVIAACLEARDPETGAPLFADAFSTAERYGLDPAAEGLPDIIAPSADGYQAMAKWSPFCTRLLRPDWELPATHWMDGIIAIDAPDLRPGGHLRAELHDLAPTTLAMLGLRIPEAMQGRILHEAFESPLPVRYDTGPAPEPAATGEALLVPIGLGGEGE